jgi:hypothetical protein
VAVWDLNEATTKKKKKKRKKEKKKKKQKNRACTFQGVIKYL